MGYRFIYKPNEATSFSEDYRVEISESSDGPSRDHLLRMFKFFLLACGFREVELTEDEDNEL
ncbi:MAG: hypothetical protein ACE5DN_04305 [Flavobacteriales bacterium]